MLKLYIYLSLALFACTHFSHHVKAQIFDAEFGNNGIAILDWPDADYLPISDFIALPDNSVYVNIAFTQNSMAVLKFLESGELDTEFGTNGLVEIPIPNQGISYGGGGMSFTTKNLVYDDQNNLYVGEPYMVLSSPPGFGYFIVCINQEGSINTSFGDNGYYILYNEATPARYGGITIDHQNNLIVAGWKTNTDPNVDFEFIPHLKKFNSSGIPVSSFGDQGVFYFEDQIDGRVMWPVINNENSIFVTGFNSNTANSEPQYHVTAVSTNGTLLNSFGDNGVLNLALEATLVNGLYITSTGNLIATQEIIGSFGSTEPNIIRLIKMNQAGNMISSFGNEGVSEIITGHMSSESTGFFTTCSELLPGDYIAVSLFDFDLSTFEMGSAMMLLQNNGSIDEAFGDEGILVIDYPLFQSIGIELIRSAGNSGSVYASFFLEDMASGDVHYGIGRLLVVDPEVNSSDIQLPKPAINIFPNPAQTYFNIQSLNDVSVTGEISVYDLYGKLILKKNVSKNPGDISKIDVPRDLPSGMYLIRKDFKGYRSISVPLFITK